MAEDLKKALLLLSSKGTTRDVKLAESGLDDVTEKENKRVGGGVITPLSGARNFL